MDKVQNKAQRIIEKFGGISALAALVGKAPGTVRYWVKVGSIPSKWHPTLIVLAESHGIALNPEDFLDGEPPDTQITGSLPISVPVAQWWGTLILGELELPAYVLSDGRRIISRSGATGVLTGKKGDGHIESYLTVQALKGYLPDGVTEQWVDFVHPGVVNKNVAGMTAETFLDICSAYVRALDENKLETERQREIAAKAAMFLAACAKVGLVALIDEATGYQYTRAEDALQVKLRAFLAEEMRKWETTFPEELWREFGRLTHWEGSIHHRPKYWGSLVMELIYEYLDPDVADWLRKNNPNPHKGQNHHQWLSAQYGLRRLTEHLWMVIGIAKACQSMSELKAKMAEIYGHQPVQLTLFLPPPRTAESPSHMPRQSH